MYEGGSGEMRLGSIGGYDEVMKKKGESESFGVVRRKSSNLAQYTPKAQSRMLFRGGETPSRSGGINSHRSISLGKAVRRDPYQKWAVRAFAMRAKKTISDLN